MFLFLSGHGVIHGHQIILHGRGQGRGNEETSGSLFNSQVCREEGEEQCQVPD